MNHIRARLTAVLRQEGLYLWRTFRKGLSTFLGWGYWLLNQPFLIFWGGG
jgi:hypothetical protein